MSQLAVGFDDQGLYYIQQNPDLNVGFIPFWGFEGLNATIMTNIDGSAKSITGTSPGQQPLPASKQIFPSIYTHDIM